jgi:hypothetical protein
LNFGFRPFAAAADRPGTGDERRKPNVGPTEALRQEESPESNLSVLSKGRAAGYGPARYVASWRWHRIVKALLGRDFLDQVGEWRLQELWPALRRLLQAFSAHTLPFGHHGP